MSKPKSYYMGCKGAFNPDQLEELEKSGLYVAEPKCDGIWASLESNGKIQKIVSRNGKQKELELPPLPKGTIVAVELGYGSEESSQRKADIGHDFADLLDIIKVGGKDVSKLDDNERRKILEKFHAGLGKKLKGYYFLLQRVSKGFRKLYDSTPEGIILKKIKDRPHRPYIFGSKSPYWYKVKRTVSVEMVVMDYEVSDADSFKGMKVAKNIVCGAYKKGKLIPLTKVAAGSCASYGSALDLRRDIVDSWENYEGSVVELNCYRVFKSGSLRHPSILRFREDKDPEDCTFESIVALA